MKQLAILMVMLGLVMGSCSRAIPTTVPTASPQPTPVSIVEKPSWWRTAVFYEIFVRSFYDSNADGMGDFNGLLQKLDYLNDGNPETHTDLGVNALWLLPIHPSPSYHGYDVVNFYALNPEYGTAEDFRIFLAEAHRRGIRVIIDLVINHTSSQHPFFQDAIRDQDAHYRDWYIWSQVPQGAGWHLLGGEYYYGYFCDCMPDLNYSNLNVTEQMEKVSKFWLEDVGVDGFRIDAAKHLIEETDIKENSPATHAWFKDFYNFYKSINPEAYAVGEVASSDAQLTASYTGDQLDQVFNFEMASGVINSVKGEAVSGIKSAVTFTLEDMPAWNFATFLTNHDQNRVMSVLGGSVEKAKLAAFILLTSPGTPFIYYGEEIGMTGQKPDEDIRRPMQWSSDSYAGFSSTEPWEEIQSDYLVSNVQDQQKSPGSLLAVYKYLIALRAAHPALQLGEYLPVESNHARVYAFSRQSNTETFLVLVNLSKESISDYALTGDIPGLASTVYSVSEIISGTPGADLTIQDEGFINYLPIETLSPHQGYIFSIQAR